jgi:hypothetical protein
MKLTPWLRTLRNGIARTFIKAKPKRREINRTSLIMGSGECAEFLEDRTVLNATIYATPVSDGVYDAGHFLQPQPFTAIVLPTDPNGNPSILIRIYFQGGVSVAANGPPAFILFNTSSSDPTAPNYPGAIGVATYQPNVNQSGAPYLDFYYEIQNGENTAGPTRPGADSYLRVIGGGNGGDGITDGAGPVNMGILPAAGRSANGKIVDLSDTSKDKFVFIDTHPVVQDINSTTLDSIPYNIDPSQGAVRRPYRVGDPPIEIQVTFSEPVAVTGTPKLALNTDGIFGIQNTDARALYKSGSGTNVLTFEYTISPGDNTSDLDVAGNAALEINNGDNIQDQDFVQDNAIPTVNGPSFNGVVPGTLGTHRSIQVDTLAPLVGPRPDQPGTPFVGVTSKDANGTYGAGQTLTLRISFDEAVVLTGSPTLVLATGPVNREATFGGFDGTDTLLFFYTVQPGDLSSDLDYISTTALHLNGGSLTDLAGNAADLTLPAPGAAGSLSFNKNLVIDTTVAVQSVSTPLPNGSYGIGQVIPITVTFNKNVTVFGTPQLLLNLDSPKDSVLVNYSSGSGTKVLTFNYTIQAGDNTSDLDYVSSSSLLLNGGAIVDTIGNGNALLTLPAPGAAGSLGFNKDILIDTNLPTIVSVSAAASVPNGTYVAGQTIPITVSFSEPVSVTGTPQITIDTNGIPGVQPFLLPGQTADAVVNYTSGSGTNTLTFNYTIAEGQNSLDLDALFLTLVNGSKIKDLAGNDLAPTGSILTLPQFPNEPLTNANLSPNVAPVAEIVDIFVGNVVPNSVYSFTAGGTTYSYTAKAADTQSTIAANLRAKVNTGGATTLTATGFGNSVRLTANTAGSPFTVTIPGASNLTQTTVRANGLPQTQVDVMTVTSVAQGTTYDFTINGVSLSYTANGTDTIGTVATAIASLINTHVTLRTQVIASANGGDITVTAGTSGTPFILSTGHSLAGNRNIVIDTAPVITNITSSTPDGTYVSGNTIAITVMFTEPVTVNTTQGIPSLLLETNGIPGAQPGSDAQAQYNSGSGTNTLTFLYTVLPGQTSVDLDYTDTLALLLNGGTIQDQDGAPANLNALLPAPGSVGSLGRNTNIQIDDTSKNDPPVNIVPGVQTTTEDIAGGVVFSTGNGNLIQVKDVDAGIGDLTVTLTGVNGTIKLPTTGGLTTISGNNSATVILTGSLSAINAALDGLTFQPAANANSRDSGTISLTISTNDNGNTGGATVTPLTDTDTIPINVIAVNDVPVAVNQTIQTAVGTSKQIILQATDPDLGDNSTFLITTQPQHGTLSLITNGNQVVYTPTPGYVGPDSFQFTDSDAVSTSTPGVITVNVVPTVPLVVGFPDIVTVEGNSGQHNAVFTITLSQPAAFPTTIDYSTSDISATAASGDYVATSSTVSFGIGEQTKTISVPIQGDIQDEPNETFAVNLSNGVNVVLLDTQAIGTIQNDDGLSIGDATAEEGDTGTTTFTFPVHLSSPSAQIVTVNYSTSNGTAVSPSDYTAIPNGSLTFSPGEVDKTISVTVKGDLLNEQDETFFVTLSSPNGSSLGKSVGVGTILNDDPLPSVSINDVSIAEGNSGTKVMTFLATLSQASGQTVTADYATSDNTATNGTDYLAAIGSISFPPGVTSVPVTVTIIGDQVFEPDETFTVTLSNIQGAQAGDLQGIGTIVNDDGLTINDVSIVEGNAGTKLMVFTVTAPQTGGATVSVDYTVSPGSVNPATPNADYTPISGTLVFTGGVTSKTISVPIIGDFIQEQNETLNVILSNPVNSPLLKDVGVGTIIDDDVTPTITATDVQIVEGNSGTKNAVFVLTLSTPTGIPVTVNYQAQSLQGTDNATAGSDYVPVQGTVTFQPFQTTASINVPIIGDILDEPTETFRLHLTQAVNATLGPSGFLDAIGTINDDDPTPTLTINDLSVNEGQAGQTTATFTVSLSAPSGQDITVHYKTSDGSATAGVVAGNNSSNDYISQEGDLTFVAGVTSQPISITINGDTLYELDETFAVDLTNPVNAGITDGHGTATIVNDDAKPGIVISDVSVFEGNSGTTPMVFTVTLLQQSALPVTVTYATSSGTALDGNDYQSAAGTLTFQPGETSKQITVNAIGDENVEPDENFFVNLSGATNAVVADALGVGTIRNDDVLPSLSVNDVSILEGDSGTRQLVFTITRSSGNSTPTSVQYSTSNGTATAGSDFNLTQGTVTFLSGETTKTVSVPINGDTTAETNETFFLNLSNPTNATIADGQGLGTILNDDNAPPVVTVPASPLLGTEDISLQITGVSVADQDANGAAEQVTLTVQHGTLTLRNDVPSGLDFSQISHNGTSVVTLTGTLDAINNTLNSAGGLIYQGVQDFNGTDTLTVSANDLGNTGNVNIPKTDTKSVTIQVANVNDDPIIDFHGSGGVGTPATPVQSTKGNAVAAFGPPNVITLSDADNANFAGGTITATNIGPFIGAKDSVSIRNQGKGSGQIGFTARGKHKGEITFGGVVIGTAHVGLAGSPLEITLNNKATATAVQALLRNITFGTSKARLSAVPRTIELTMTDGSGGSSATIATTVNVTN